MGECRIVGRWLALTLRVGLPMNFAKNEKPIRIWRSKDLRTTSVNLTGRLCNIEMRIRARISARGRRAIALAFFRQIRPWLKHFDIKTIRHLEDGYWNLYREEERGVKTFRAKTVNTVTGRLGYRIRIRRLKLGWSQMDLASRCGINRAHLSNIEQGLHMPQEKTLRKLESALGIHLQIPDLETEIADLVSDNPTIAHTAIIKGTFQDVELP